MKNIINTISKISLLFFLIICSSCKQEDKKEKNKAKFQNNKSVENTGIKKENYADDPYILQEIDETCDNKIIKKYKNNAYYEWKLDLSTNDYQEKASIMTLISNIDEFYPIMKKFKELISSENIDLATKLLYESINKIPFCDHSNNKENKFFKTITESEKQIVLRYLLYKGATPSSDLFDKMLEIYARNYTIVRYATAKISILLSYGYAPNLDKNSIFLKRLEKLIYKISKWRYGLEFLDDYKYIFLSNLSYPLAQSFLYKNLPEPDKGFQKILLERRDGSRTQGIIMKAEDYRDKNLLPILTPEIILESMKKDFFKNICYGLLKEKQVNPLPKSFYNYIMENNIIEDESVKEELKKRAEI